MCEFFSQAYLSEINLNPPLNKFRYRYWLLCTPLLCMMATDPANLDTLCVLYQSNDYIVVDKHWDIRIDSKMWYEKQTVQSQLRHHFPQLADPSTYYGFR